MNDELLRHLCRLSSVAVSMVRDDSFVDALAGGLGEREARDVATTCRILADAFVELARRQDMLPTFRVPAERGEVL